MDATRREEQRLDDRGGLLRQILDAASVAIFLVDRQGRITHANRRMAEMFGWPLATLVGCEYVDLIHPSERETGQQKMLALLTSEIASVDLDRRYWRKDGSVFWGRLSGRRFHDVRGVDIGLIGVIADITEQKRAEGQLRASESRYRAIVDSQAEFVVRYQPGGILTFVNDTLCRYGGWSRERLVGSSYYPFIHPDDREALIRNVEALDREHPSMVAEARIVLPDGRVTWHQWTHLAIFDAQARIVEYQCTGRDVTDVRHAVMALRESEAKYRRLYHETPVLLHSIDRDGVLVEVSDHWLRTLGYERHEVIGRKVADFCTDESRRLAEEVVHPAFFRDGVVTGVPFQFVKKSGEIVHVLLSATAERDATGAVLRSQAVAEDVTERRLLEEERLKTQKLESVGTLAGGIAHDFNNLLQGVFGYISMARLAPEHGRSLAMLEKAEQALHQAVNLTSQLLTFSKGGKPLKKVLALPPLIESAAAFSLSGSRTICRLVAEPDLWNVEADGGQIAQVVQNVVLNADQAMPLGGLIEIRVRNLPGALPTGDAIEITVRDCGVGIPVEHLPKIFDPYFTTKERGSGLGLATSHSIVRNHGGALRVASVLGQGTTVTVLLPACPRPVEAPPPAGVPEGGRRARILFMDDEELVRDVAVELARSLGHTVEAVGRGEEAIERYREARDAGRPYDLVILDLTIRGGMGGLETLRRLREIDPGVKAVVSSGYADSGAMGEYRRHGFAGCLHKPYTAAALRGELDALLA